MIKLSTVSNYNTSAGLPFSYINFVKETYQVMSLSRLYKVDISTGVDVHRVSSLVGGQQEAVIPALVGEAGQEL